jgi:hypothetical protein
MNDVHIGLDQKLIDNLLKATPFPLDIDVANKTYFNDNFLTNEFETDPESPEERVLTDDLSNMVYGALNYAVIREDDDTSDTQAQEEDMTMYELAALAVDAYLKVHPEEVEVQRDSLPYNVEDSKGLWDRIKKWANKVKSWLKTQGAKIVTIKSVKISRLDVTILRQPHITVSKPIKVYDIYLKVNIRCDIKYSILGMGGRVSFSGTFSFSDVDLNVGFEANGLKYMAVPEFKRFNIVIKIKGIKITIGIAKYVNKFIKPMEIFDAAKVIPSIPWFGKQLKPKAPLGVDKYSTGIQFGVDMQVTSQLIGEQNIGEENEAVSLMGSN